MAGSLLIAGTTSDAGKSVVTAGLGRLLHRRGISVAPFKAQNMSNNSAVTADGGEIGRAQALQARACGVEPSVAMNPVLLKPGSDRSSHVLVNGRPYTQVTALNYRELKTQLRASVLAGYDQLRSQYDVVLCEGAGSPAEINLRSGDLANMWLADQRNLATVLVGDIDRGGVFAAFYGTIALLSARDQSSIAGFIVNKFRGDAGVLAPGLATLTELTGRSVVGVLPWLPDLNLDAEDSLSLPSSSAKDSAEFSIAAIRLPRVSNTTDLQAFACEPGVAVRWTTSVADIAAADLVVLPGTRSTVADLRWLHARGLAEAIRARAEKSLPILGICGGYQMLARTISDEVESDAGAVDGLGLLPVDICFQHQKVVGRPSGVEYGHPVDTAYEIHHGVATMSAAAQPFLDGCREGSVWGTTWHGAFDSDDFRRAFLVDTAVMAGRTFRPAEGTCVAAIADDQLNRVADAIEQNLDVDALLDLITDGPPTALPFLPPGAPA